MNDQEKSEQQLAEEYLQSVEWYRYHSGKDAFLAGRRSRDPELAQLKADRSAFAEETQRYRDAWLSDQKELAQRDERIESILRVIEEYKITEFSQMEGANEKEFRNAEYCYLTLKQLHEDVLAKMKAVDWDKP